MNCRPDVFQHLLHGDGGGFLGVLTLLEQEYATATDQDRRERAGARFAARSPAPLATVPGCGRKPTPSASAAKRSPKSAGCRSPQPSPSFAAWTFRLRRRPIAEPLLKEILQRLAFLQNVGVDYLTLHRSGRHAQRRRTATRPPGHRHRFGTGRRVLRAGRAVDRPAPARQPPA